MKKESKIIWYKKYVDMEKRVTSGHVLFRSYILYLFLRQKLQKKWKERKITMEVLSENLIVPQFLSKLMFSIFPNLFCVCYGNSCCCNSCFFGFAMDLGLVAFSAYPLPLRVILQQKKWHEFLFCTMVFKSWVVSIIWLFMSFLFFSISFFLVFLIFKLKSLNVRGPPWREALCPGTMGKLVKPA